MPFKHLYDVTNHKQLLTQWIRAKYPSKSDVLLKRQIDYEWRKLLRVSNASTSATIDADGWDFTRARFEHPNRFRKMKRRLRRCAVPLNSAPVSDNGLSNV